MRITDLGIAWALTEVHECIPNSTEPQYQFELKLHAERTPTPPRGHSLASTSSAYNSDFTLQFRRKVHLPLAFPSHPYFPPSQFRPDILACMLGLLATSAAARLSLESPALLQKILAPTKESDPSQTPFMRGYVSPGNATRSSKPPSVSASEGVLDFLRLRPALFFWTPEGDLEAFTVPLESLLPVSL